MAVIKVKEAWNLYPKKLCVKNSIKPLKSWEEFQKEYSFSRKSIAPRNLVVPRRLRSLINKEEALEKWFIQGFQLEFEKNDRKYGQVSTTARPQTNNNFYTNNYFLSFAQQCDKSKCDITSQKDETSKKKFPKPFTFFRVSTYAILYFVSQSENSE